MSSNQQKLAQFESLPEDLKQTLLSESTREFIHNLSAQYGAREKADVIYDVVAEVLRGERLPRELATILASRVALSANDAMTMAVALTENVLFPVRASLEKLYGEKLEGTPPAQEFEYVRQLKAGEMEMKQLEEEERAMRERKPLATPAPDQPIPIAKVPLTEMEAIQKKKEAYSKKEPAAAPGVPAAKKPSDKYREEPSEEELEQLVNRFGRKLPSAPQPEKHKVIDLGTPEQTH